LSGAASPRGRLAYVMGRERGAGCSRRNQ
jgi:hypothetical protein